MKIYTRTGDKGQTSLFTGDRVDKDSPFIEALGAVDECNSTLGIAISLLPNTDQLIPIRQQLEVVQHAMFDLGAAIATPASKANGKKLEKTRFNDSSTGILEMWIDRMEETLPKLHYFILPGGHPAGATLHLARSLCRRAERCVLPLQQLGEVSPEVLIYLNRLSDYLFVVSRYVNHALAMPETAWVHSSKPAN